MNHQVTCKLQYTGKRDKIDDYRIERLKKMTNFSHECDHVLRCVVSEYLFARLSVPQSDRVVAASADESIL